MKKFYWKGIKNNQYLTGDIEALTKDEAIYKLKEDGVILTSLISKDDGPAEKKKGLKGFSLFKKRVDLVQVSALTKKISTMLKSGLPIMKTLEMVKDQVEDQNMADVLEDIYKDVESGTQLSVAFSKKPEMFDTIYVNMVRAGESSGRLDTFLNKLVISINKNIKIKKSIKAALMYPAILMTVAILVLAVMMVFVVPVFVKMFGSVGSELPGPTQLVVSISDFVRDPITGGGTVALIVVVVVLFKNRVKNNLQFRRKWHQLILKIPVIGDLALKSQLAQMAMVYSNLNDAGVPVIESLDITASSSKNEILKEAMQAAKRGVFSGTPLSELLMSQPAIPKAFSQMVYVGEQTGNMSDMLNTISSYYEEEFDDAVVKFSQLMEPIMIVFLGGVIGFILVAMYLPIFKMGQVVTG